MLSYQSKGTRIGQRCLHLTQFQLSFCARCTNTSSEKKGSLKQHPQLQHKSCKLIRILKSAPQEVKQTKNSNWNKKKREKGNEREIDWICLRNPKYINNNSQKAYLRKAKGLKIHQKSKTRESSCMNKI